MSTSSNCSQTLRGSLRTGTRRVTAAPVTIIVVTEAPKPRTHFRLTEAQHSVLRSAARHRDALEPRGATLAMCRRLRAEGLLQLDREEVVKGKIVYQSFRLTDFGRKQLEQN